ncbi:hypothetical protein DNTS_025702 [Danionella cerebrum]|uniref:Uncharacterized protein n=1 Tax=Danionella cerebrum TaxID=2873325 RepID=A0A553MTC4_9TELE|nr:hypothetical protein DNTS_025702 [Danionella translucida]
MAQRETWLLPLKMDRINSSLSLNRGQCVSISYKWREKYVVHSLLSFCICLNAFAQILNLPVPVLRCFQVKLLLNKNHSICHKTVKKSTGLHILLP